MTHVILQWEGVQPLGCEAFISQGLGAISQ